MKANIVTWEKATGALLDAELRTWKAIYKRSDGLYAIGDLDYLSVGHWHEISLRDLRKEAENA
jgi:hypothetical protein